jgi:hypothetical protein
MRVICEQCETESNEADMDADCRGDDTMDEEWSNHICPHCNFWNYSPSVWDAEGAGKDLVDLRFPQ